MGRIPTERVLDKLDEHFGRNDYDSAEKACGQHPSYGSVGTVQLSALH